MAVHRYRSDVDRTRRGAGWIFIAIAVGLAAWLTILAGRLTVTGMVFYALLGGLFYLGLRLIRPKDLFEIDVERRTYTVIRDGKRAGSGSLDELGPLEVRSYVYRSGDRRSGSALVRYTVCAAIHSQIDFCMVRSAGKARRRGRRRRAVAAGSAYFNGASRGRGVPRRSRQRRPRHEAPRACCVDGAYRRQRRPSGAIRVAVDVAAPRGAP